MLSGALINPQGNYGLISTNLGSIFNIILTSGEFAFFFSGSHKPQPAIITISNGRFSALKLRFS